MHGHRIRKASLAAAWLIVLPTPQVWSAPLPNPLHLSADPDTPAIGISWRGSSHALAGADIPVYEASEGKGFQVYLPGSIQLHNTGRNPVPHHTWRGLIGLDVSYRLQLENGSALRFSFLVNHESDHQTRRSGILEASPKGFYDRNSIGTRVIWEIPLGYQQLTVKAVGRWHIVTCTIAPDVCTLPATWAGSRGAELTLEAMWEANGGFEPDGRWGPFASLYFDRLFPHRLISAEARAVLMAGIWIHAPVGLSQVFGIGWFGHDIGYLHHRQVAQIGLGLRWTL